MNLLPRRDLLAIESHLGAVLDRVLSADGLSSLHGLLKSHVLSGGKRLRPQLCLWTYRSIVGDDADVFPPAILDLACAWEIFHAFVLAHDDIIDNGDTRRDRPSLHRQLAQLDSGSAAFGMNLGIVAGDLLFGAAMRLLHDLDLPPQPYRDILQLFSRVVCATGFGQAIDIVQSHVPLSRVDEQTLLREYEWKTAAYTFEGPMLSAAIAAGAAVESRPALSQFALALGRAYQLHNDLVDLTTPATPGCDLAQGKRTLALIRARAAMPEHDQRHLDTALAVTTGPEISLGLTEQLRQNLLRAGAVAQTRSAIAELLGQAAQGSLCPAAGAPLRRGMTELLGTLTAEYFAMK